MEEWIIYQFLDQRILKRLLEIVTLNEGNREIEKENVRECKDKWLRRMRALVS